MAALTNLPDEVATYFDKQTGAVRDIAHALGEVVAGAAPDAAVKLAWGFPCWIGAERIASVIAHSEHCNLQLWSGARLSADFPNRIEGTGKDLRHVKVRKLSDIDAELKEIVSTAVALDQTAPRRVR